MPDLLSIFAIVISGISLLISWRTYRRDRADLRPKLEYSPESDIGARFNVRVVNHGRRPARVEYFSIRFKSDEPIWDSVAAGREVTEAEPVNFWLPIFDHTGTPARDPTQVTGLEVVDTLGNKYKYPGLSFSNWLEFREMKEQIRQHWESRS